MHDRDTYANPLAAPIEREPVDPSADAITDVRHLAAMCRAQGRVDGIREERARDIALIIAHLGIITDDFTSPAKLLAAATKLLAAIRSGEAAP